MAVFVLSARSRKAVNSLKKHDHVCGFISMGTVFLYYVITHLSRPAKIEYNSANVFISLLFYVINLNKYNVSNTYKLVTTRTKTC